MEEFVTAFVEYVDVVDELEPSNTQDLVTELKASQMLLSKVYSLITSTQIHPFFESKFTCRLSQAFTKVYSVYVNSQGCAQSLCVTFGYRNSWKAISLIVQEYSNRGYYSFPSYKKTFSFCVSWRPRYFFIFFNFRKI